MTTNQQGNAMTTTESEDHPDYAYYISCGCRDVSHSLGFTNMPKPWALMIDADGMFYFGFNKRTGVEMSPTWDKWSVYRSCRMEQEG